MHRRAFDAAARDKMPMVPGGRARRDGTTTYENMKSVLGGIWNKIDGGRSFLPASLRYDVVCQQDYACSSAAGCGGPVEPPSNCAYSDNEEDTPDGSVESTSSRRDCLNDGSWTFYDSIVELLGDADTLEVTRRCLSHS